MLQLVSLGYSLISEYGRGQGIWLKFGRGLLEIKEINFLDRGQPLAELSRSRADFEGICVEQGLDVGRVKWALFGYASAAGLNSCG
jgi:hypothetical protein